MAKSRRRNDPDEILGLLYSKRGPLMYGHILFAKYREGSEPVSPHKVSAPFVISETIGPNEEKIVGSIVGLIENILFLVNDIEQEITNLGSSMKEQSFSNSKPGEYSMIVELPDDEVVIRKHFYFKQRVAGMLILLSVQSRNLFELFPRLSGDMRIMVSDGKITKKMKIRELMVHFIHNRYLFLDGEDVHNLFPYKPRPSAPINSTFLGYKFNWIEYMGVISCMAKELTINDLVGFLRGKLQKLSLNTPYGDMVSLLQNIHSLSNIMVSKIGDPRYNDMFELIFDEEIASVLRGIEPGKEKQRTLICSVAFYSPSIKIHDNLSQKKFNIFARCKVTIRTKDDQMIHNDVEFRSLTREVNYAKLFDLITDKFGDDKLWNVSRELLSSIGRGSTNADGD